MKYLGVVSGILSVILFIAGFVTLVFIHTDSRLELLGLSFGMAAFAYINMNIEFLFDRLMK